MGMREKLIELLLQDGCPEDGCDFCQYAESEHCRAEVIADRMIANGVTTPVRCKECRHWSDGVSGCTDHVKCCKIGFYMVGENGYCVYGERRTDD
jgi:hypothetical protein